MHSPLAPACRGHQGCGVRPYKDKERTKIFATTLCCYLYRKPKSEVDPPRQNKNSGAVTALKMLQYASLISGPTKIKAAPNASKKQQKTDPKTKNNEFQGKNNFSKAFHAEATIWKSQALKFLAMTWRRWRRPSHVQIVLGAKGANLADPDLELGPDTPPFSPPPPPGHSQIY